MMDSNTLSSFLEIVHAGSLVVLAIILFFAAAAFYRPSLLRMFSKNIRRDYALACGVFACLICSTVFLATQPPNQDTHVSEDTKQTISAIDTLQTDAGVPAQEIKTEDVEMKETVPFTKEIRHDPSLPGGQTKQLQAGVDGQVSRIYTITYHNGDETGRVLKSETVTLAPVVEITVTGTNPEVPAFENKTNGKSESNKSKSLRDFLPRF